MNVGMTFMGLYEKGKKKKKKIELRFVWLGGWKYGRIKNVLFSLICVWLEKWKNGEMKTFWVWLRRKIKE